MKVVSFEQVQDGVFEAVTYFRFLGLFPIQRTWRCHFDGKEITWYDGKTDEPINEILALWLTRECFD